MIPRWIRTIGRPLLPRFVRQRMNAHLDWLELRLGRKIWPTKDVGFWVMMELLLLKTRPRCIAEFGSGRSTSVLAGYAHTRGADFFSFEDNAAFVRRVRAGLHGALLPSHYVHHAKITADRWYDVGVIKRTMTNPPDLLFIDGPSVVTSAGLRDCPAAIACYRDFMPSVRILMVDDIDRPVEYDLAMTLLAGTDLTARYFIKDTTRAITCIALRPELAKNVDETDAPLLSLGKDRSGRVSARGHGHDDRRQPRLITP